MNEPQKTTKTSYTIEYSPKDNPNSWFFFFESGKSYVEACNTLRDLIQLKTKRKDIGGYRIVENVITTTTEVLKTFPIIN